MPSATQLVICLVIAVLIFCFALWAGSGDIAISEKQLFFRIKQLFNVASGDMAICIDGLIDRLR